MTNDEIDTLMSAIKNTYPNFSINEGVIEEWTKRLRNYDFADVENAFNKYVLAGNKETISIVDLIRDLKTIEQKKPKKGDYFCTRCGKHYETPDEADKCYERDMDIAYIRRMCKKLMIDETEYFGNLKFVTLDEINANYNDFILRILKENKKRNVLRGLELDGVMLYYNNVIAKETNKRFEELEEDE